MDERLAGRISGCLLGMVVGDAMGMPADGMSPWEVWLNFQKMDGYHGCPRTKSKPGTYTGITQLAMTCSGCLAEAPDLDTNVLASKLLGMHKKGSLRARHGVSEAMGRLSSGASMADLVGEDGEYMAMMPPIGVVAACKKLPDSWLVSSCRAAASVSTLRKQAMIPGVAIAWLARELAKYEQAVDSDELYSSDESAISRLISFCENLEAKAGVTILADRMSSRITHARDRIDVDCKPEEFAGSCGSSWRATEAAGLAIFCFLKSVDEEASIRVAAGLGGAAPLVAALVGGLVGAYMGPSFLGTETVDSLENSAKITSAASGLAEAILGDAR